MMEPCLDAWLFTKSLEKDYANPEEAITGKQMIVPIGNNSTVDNVLNYDMLFKTEGADHMGNFKEVVVDAYNETEEESDTEENDISGSDSEDLDYDPKHDDVFDDDEHILEDVHIIMYNFIFNPDPKHDLSIAVVEVHEHDLDVIDYDSFSGDLDDGIDYERRIQLRELKRLGKKKTMVPISGSVIRENNISGKQNMGHRKAAGVKVVQVKLVVLVNRVEEKDKLLVQGINIVKLLVLVNKVNHKDKLLVQGMPQVKLLVLVNLVQHQAKQAKDQDNIVRDQLKHVRDLGKVSGTKTSFKFWTTKIDQENFQQTQPKKITILVQ
nr:hypothetical protein [Tanacetum cinerariifolium]